MCNCKKKKQPKVLAESPPNDSDTSLFISAPSGAKFVENVEAGDIFSGWTFGSDDDTSFSYNITAADNSIAIIFIMVAVLFVFGLVGFVVYKNT